MQRRLARERREFIFRKAKEQQQRVQHDKKQKLKAALESGKPMPTEIRNDAVSLKRAMDFDDPDTEKLADSRDDEYRLAGVLDPKVVVTTSRDPSARLKMFAKEFKLIFPESQRLNRGTYVLPELVRVCNSNAVTDLIVIHEHRGEPDGITVCHLPFGPTASFSLSSVVMRHDIQGAGTMSEAYPHLIFDNFQTKLGERCMNILKFLFPVPKDDSKRTMTFSNREDYISFRHHTYTKTGTDIALQEVGPRFEMKLYSVKLGTLDQVDAEVEWVSKPYMNTAKKKRFL